MDPVISDLYRYLDQQDEWERENEPETYASRCYCCGQYFSQRTRGTYREFCFKVKCVEKRKAQEAAYLAEREANLQRWGLRPKGVAI